MSGFIVKLPGLLTTVQDAGRFGLQGSGFSPAGAMDIHALRVANILADNPMDEAALEITVMGPTLEFMEDEVIAIAGADLSPMVDRVPIPNYQAVSIKKGQALSFGARRSGCRAYIAFTGGLDVPELYGSRSTLLRNKIGGINGEGRGLKKDDQVDFRAPKATIPNLAIRKMEPEKIEDSAIDIRVIMGPQEERFTKKGIETFLGDKGYVVSNLCDRQGYRLEGDTVEHVTDGNIVSDGIALGAVQIPSNGQPIIMLAERQSTGGYTKIANVISCDFSKIAQSFAGSHIRFVECSLEQAQDLMIQEREYLERLKAGFAAAPVSKKGPEEHYRIIIDGAVYNVTVERCL